MAASSVHTFKPHLLCFHWWGFPWIAVVFVIGSRRWGPATRGLLGSTGETLVQGMRAAPIVVCRILTRESHVGAGLAAEAGTVGPEQPKAC